MDLSKPKQTKREKNKKREKKDKYTLDHVEVLICGYLFQIQRK